VLKQDVYKVQPTNLSDNFVAQLELSFRTLFKDEIRKISTVMDLSHFLIVKNYYLLPTFHDLYSAFLLFLTMQSQHILEARCRMTDYMGWRFCQFENAEARKVDVGKIIDDFQSG